MEMYKILKRFNHSVGEGRCQLFTDSLQMLLVILSSLTIAVFNYFPFISPYV